MSKQLTWVAGLVRNDLGEELFVMTLKRSVKIKNVDVYLCILIICLVPLQIGNLIRINVFILDLLIVALYIS